MISSVFISAGVNYVNQWMCIYSVIIKVCVLTCLFSLPVQAGIPDIILLYLSHLPVRLEQVPSSLLLQMVHSSELHALSGGAFCGAGAQAAGPPALRGPQPHPHSTGLGEDWSGGWQQQITANIASQLWTLVCTENADTMTTVTFLQIALSAGILSSLFWMS